jgi:hypothetical protein
LFGALGRLIPGRHERREERAVAGEEVSDIEAEQIASRFGRANGA